MAFISLTQKTQGVSGWDVDITRYYEYDETALTCDQALAQFMALSAADRLAKTTAVEPAAPAGKQRSLRDCSMVSEEVAIDASTSDFEGVTTTPVTTGDGFDVSYTYSKSGKDFQNNAFVTTPAPAVVAQQKSKPRAGAGRYDFAVQTALNTFLPQRHPAFTLPFSWNGTKMTGWLVPYPGPDVSAAAERAAVVSRGFNGVTDVVPNLTAFGNGIGVFNVNGGYDEALTAANRLLDSDGRKAILKKWNNDNGVHRLTNDAAACEWLGREIYIQKQNQDWTSAQGGPVLAITLNFEIGVAPDGQSAEQYRMDMIGLVMRGVRNEAIARGHVVPLLICYDHGGLCHYNTSLISRDLTTASGSYGDDGSNAGYTNAIVGLPAYFEGALLGIAVKGGSGTSPMATTNEMVKYVKEFGGVMGSQEYPNATWDDQSYWQKDANGAFLTRTAKDQSNQDVKLLVRRTDARRTTIQGEIADLLGPAPYYEGEGDDHLFEQYQRALYGTADYTTRAGRVHYATSDVRQAGFEKMLLGQWTRADAEFKQPYKLQKPDNSGAKINPATGAAYSQDVLNTRPRNADAIEFDVIHHLVCCLRDVYRTWMGPQPVITTLGQSLDGTAYASYGNHARAVYEILQKALNRANQFAWVKSNLMQPLWGELPIRNFARDRAWHNLHDEFEKKAIVNALLCSSRSDRSNTPWLVLAGTFPAMDVGTTTTLTVWATNADGTPLGGSYSIQMGRSIGIDDFQLPATHANLPPAQWRYQYTDMTGELRTRCFDYRVAIPTTNLNPPAAV